MNLSLVRFVSRLLVVCLLALPFQSAQAAFVNRQADTGLRASVQALLTFVNGLGLLIGNERLRGLEVG